MPCAASTRQPQNSFSLSILTQQLRLEITLQLTKATYWSKFVAERGLGQSLMLSHQAGKWTGKRWEGKLLASTGLHQSDWMKTFREFDLLVQFFNTFEHNKAWWNSFYVTVLITKLKGWPYQNSLAKYPNIARCLRIFILKTSSVDWQTALKG